MTRVFAVVRESFSSARAQRVASIVTIVMTAGMCLAVLLTTGRTVGAEDAVLRSIDSAGTRSIIVRAEAAAGLDSSVLDRIGHLEGVEWAGAFGPATDVTATAIAGGTRVPVRTAFGAHLDSLGIGTSIESGRTAWASELALQELGLVQGAGGVTTETGDAFAIVGKLDVPDYLAFLEPAVFVPQTGDEPEDVAIVVVVAERPDLVDPVAAAVLSVLAVDDPTAVTVETSAALAQVRAAVQGQLGQFGRALILIILGLTGVLVAAILFGLVMLRRRDYGRRRALGATKGLIVAIVLIQTAIPALVGSCLGTFAALAALAALRDPLPNWDFSLAVALMATGVAVVAAGLPAVIAAQRDPLRELRVP